MSKIKVDKKRLKKVIAISVIILVLLVVIILKYDDVFETKKTYTVINGYVEKVSDSTGILVKDELIVNVDNTKSLINVVEQYTRVSKNGIIATYKDESYNNYMQKVNDLDKTLETLVKDLPSTYSTEVASINQQISTLAKETKNTNSLLKIQEYKNKLDELSYKKVSLLGEYSPSGSKIRELIEEREELEESIISSSNNVIAPISGAVTYKIDKLEDVVDVDKILKYSENDIDNFFAKYTNNSVSEYGIKIVDNYNAYFILRTLCSESDVYIKEGKNYTIKTTEQDEYEFTGNLVKNMKSGDYNYSIFNVENGIENIIDYRTIGLEVVWNKTEGLAVLNTGLNESLDGRYKFVTLVYGGQYIDIPVKVINSDENISIVENYTNEELTQLGLTKNATLSRYDIIVVQ